MNKETKTHLRITGLGIVIAALLGTWAFGKKEAPGPAPAPANAPATSSPASTAIAGISAPATAPDAMVERGLYVVRAGTVEGAGAMIYLNNCNACHGSSGAVANGVFPSLAGNSVVNAKDPTSLIRIVLGGSAMPSTEKAPAALAMPGFGWRLTDAKIADLLSYVRVTWGNKAEPVTAAQVADVRATFKPAELAQTKP